MFLTEKCDRVVRFILRDCLAFQFSEINVDPHEVVSEHKRIFLNHFNQTRV